MEPHYVIKVTTVDEGLSTSLGLTVTDSVRSLKSLGLALSPITLNNLSEDKCSLTWVRDLGDVPPFLPEDIVEIFLRTGTAEEPEDARIFMGRIQDPETSHSDADESAVYEVLGPFGELRRHYFSRTPYGVGELDIDSVFSLFFGTTEVHYKVADHIDVAHAGTVGDPILVTAGIMIDARGHLFDPPTIFPPTYRSLTAQLTELFQYVTDRTEDEPGGSMFQFDPDNWEIGTEVYPRLSTFQDTLVADLVIRAAGWKPGLAFWFDYSQSPPMLHVRAASEVEPEELDLASPLVSLVGRARGDLQVSGVVLRYQPSSWGYGALTYNRGWTPADKLDVYPPAAKADDARVLCMTFVSENTFLVPDFAEAIYNEMNVLRYQGRLLLDDPDWERDLHPGCVFAVVGDHAGMRYGQILVQSTVRNPMTGQWSCTLGLPAVLDIQTRRDLRGWMQLTINGPGYSFSRTLPSPS